MKTFLRDNVSLDYHLILEDRKTISATVFPSSEVLVKAPLDATVPVIEKFLYRKLRWLLKQKRYFAQFGPVRKKRFVSGETFQYRGKSYKLLLHGDSDASRVTLQHGVLNVFIKGDKSSVGIQRFVNEWYLNRARAVFSHRLALCFKMFDYPSMPALAVRRMNRRWGSYQQRSNQIILNLELIRAATRYIDYVIVHELCHISHRKHSREFYQLLETKLPDWRRLKAELELRLPG